METTIATPTGGGGKRIKLDDGDLTTATIGKLKQEPLFNGKGKHYNHVCNDINDQPQQQATASPNMEATKINIGEQQHCHTDTIGAQTDATETITNAMGETKHTTIKHIINGTKHTT